MTSLTSRKGELDRVLGSEQLSLHHLSGTAPSCCNCSDGFKSLQAPTRKTKSSFIRSLLRCHADLFYTGKFYCRGFARAQLNFPRETYDEAAIEADPEPTVVKRVRDVVGLLLLDCSFH